MWKVSVEGGEPVRVTDYPAVQPSVSPDGKLIAYMYYKTRPEPKLYVALIDGGDPIKTFDVPPLPAFDIEWTPDGKSVVYNALENGVEKIFSQPLDGGAPQILLAAGSGLERISAFTFSRDGKQLIYSAGTGKRDAVMFTLER
jgi:Tol biopolymer transport system component